MRRLVLCDIDRLPKVNHTRWGVNSSRLGSQSTIFCYIISKNHQYENFHKPNQSQVHYGPHSLLTSRTWDAQMKWHQRGFSEPCQVLHSAPQTPIGGVCWDSRVCASGPGTVLTVPSHTEHWSVPGPPTSKATTGLGFRKPTFPSPSPFLWSIERVDETLLIWVPQL